MAKLLTGTRIYGTGTVDTQLFVNGAEQSTSTTTGALEVVGGAGIGGNLYVGGIAVSSGVQSTNIVASGTLGVTGTSTLGVLNATSATFSGTLGVTGTSTLGVVNATSATFSGVSTITNITSATSTQTGALQVRGGVSIGGALHVQQTSFINGSQILTAATIGSFGVSAITAGTDTVVSTSTGAVIIWNTSTLQSVTNRGAVTTNQVTLNNGLIFGSTSQNPILMNASYSQSTPGFIIANGTLVGTTATTQIYAFNYQHNLAPVSTATISSYYGQLVLPTLQNTATYGGMYGTFARIDMGAAATTGTVGTWIGFTSEPPSRNAASDVRFTNHYGFRAQDPASITATNVIGFVSQIASGTNRYNIYASGTADNYFNGSVGIGGLPTVKLDVTGAVKISGVTTVTNNTQATSTVTGALQVVGGVGIGGNLYVGGTSNLQGVTATNIVASGTLGVTGTSTLSVVNATSATFSGTLGVTGTSVLNGLQASNIVASGTLGVTGTSILAGLTTITNTTSATSTSSGALQVRGGVGIGGALYVQETSYVNGSQILTVATIGNFGVSTITAGTDTVVSSSTGSVIIWNTSTLQSITNRGATTTNAIYITNTTQATSTDTGAFKVVGGAGIGRNLYVGGISVLAGVQSTNIVASGTLGVTGTSTLSLLNATSATFSGTLGVTGTSVLNGLQATNIVASGTLGVTGTSILAGVQASNIVASGTLGVTGTSTLGLLNATSGTFSGTLGVTGTSVLNGLQATNIVASGTLGVTGTSTLAGLTTVTNTTAATSTNTGALQVRGGVGIGGDLRVGGVIYGTFNGSITGNATTATNIAGGTPGQVPYQTAGGVTSFYGPGTAGNVLVSNGTAAPTYNNTLTLTSVTAATSTSTGALQVRGGVGIGGAVWANSVIAVNTISNGVNLANFVARPDGTTSSQRTGVSFYGTFFNFPGDTGVRRTADIISGFSTGIWGTEYLSFNVGNGGVANDAALLTTEQVRITTTATLILSTTTSVSTTTGALVVAGGVGIGKSLFVQESIVQVGGTYSTLATTFNLINTTATTVNFAGAATALTVGATSGSTTVRNNLSVTGNLTVQGTTTIVDSTVTNIADPIITLGGGAGNTNPIADDNKDRGIAFKWVNNGGTTSTGFFGYDDSTGYLTYIQTATITNEVVSGTKGAVDANLAGGTAMSIHYQSAVDTTAFLAASTAGFILQTNGTGAAPTWVNASGVSAGSATNADNIRTIAQTTNATYYPTFVDSNNAANAYESLYTTSSFSINAQNGTVIYSGITSATSTSTGALQVRGGVGIGGTLYVGNLRADATTSATTWGVFYNTTTKELTTATAGSTTSASGTGTTSTFVINNSTAATSTNTGALQVVNGGAGIGGSIYAGGDIFTRGTKVIPLSIQEFTATAGQITFTISGGYTVGTVQVFANGINLDSTDFAASNGTTVVVAEPRAVNDRIKIISGGTSSAMNNAQNFSIAMSVALSM